MHFDDVCDRLNTVRDYINTPRIQYPILRDRGAWHKLCSSLDIVRDTGLAISAYVDTAYPEDTGAQYLFLFGLFQAVYVQTDALKHIAEALSIELQIPKDVQELRELRNDVAGHPTLRRGKRTSNFISQISLSKAGFDLTTVFPDDRDHIFRRVNVAEAIQQEMTLACHLLNQVIETMKERDAKHRAEFASTKCAEIFPQTMGYYFSKVFEGIHSPDPGRREFGQMHIRLIEEVYTRFKEELERRGEIPASDGIAYHLEEIMYPIGELKAFFSDPAASRLNDRDAAIFAAFIRDRHETMVEIAKEVDERYGNEQPD